jgi:hypothetical protein
MPLSRIPLSLIPRPRRTPLSLAAAARRWSTSSQTRARRNAMVALTSLAERRAEREDADAYLEAAHRRSDVELPTQRRSADGS